MNTKMTVQKHVNKGFTLIELIAIISVLGILALIAVPVVSNVVNESKIKGYRLSCENYIDAVQKYIVEAQMNGTPVKNGVYDLEYFSDKIEMNYDNEYTGTVVISKSNIYDYSITTNEKTFTKENNEIVYLEEDKKEKSKMKNQEKVFITEKDWEYQYEWEPDYRSSIKNIYFRNITIPDDLVVEKYDITGSGSKPIYAYILLNKDDNKDSSGNKIKMYDLYIASENIINFPDNSSQMFRTYSNTVTVNFENIDTSNVTSFSWTFGRMKKLIEINAEVLDVSSATRLDQMFNGDSNLKHLEISNWNTSNITNLAWFSNNCYSLDGLDVSKWDVRKVTNIQGMFWSSGAVKITGLQNWKITNKLTNMKWFSGTLNTGEDNLDLTNWDTSNVTDMSYAFQNIRVKTIDISTWNTSSVKYMDNMFNFSTLLERIYVGDNWNTDSVITSTNMFDKTTNLPNYDSSKVDASMATTNGYLTKK